jgi:hypothetical protein
MIYHYWHNINKKRFEELNAAVKTAFVLTFEKIYSNSGYFTAIKIFI